MPRGLLYGADHHVAAWAWRTFQRRPMAIDRAVGIIDNDRLVGAAIWQNFNGHNVDFSYYGPGTASLGIARSCAAFALDTFDPARVTVMTARPNKKIAQFMTRIGAKFEGSSRHYYGRAGAASTAVRFVVPRQVLEALAGRQSA